MSILRGRFIGDVLLPVLALMAWGIALAWCAAANAGCALFRSVDVPRETARGAVLTTASAVKLADTSCAALAIANKDAKLAKRCADAYDGARKALLVSSASVDAWEKASARDEVTCALVDAAPHLEEMGRAINDGGGRVPPIVDDALKAIALLGACAEVKP